MSAEKLVLVIGSRNYSSWSLRPWLVLRRCGVDFDEEVIELRQPNTLKILRERSPSGLVPFLKHGDRLVWDTLSICEYLAEAYPEVGLWPTDAHVRAVARSMSAEMHAGFAAMRQAMPMDFLATVADFVPDAAVEADIKRIVQLWTEARTQFGQGGAFLFGSWSIADAMYAPVVSRFKTYGIDTDELVASYMGSVCAEADWHAWEDACREEFPPSGS